VARGLRDWAGGVYGCPAADQRCLKTRTLAFWLGRNDMERGKKRRGVQADQEPTVQGGKESRFFEKKKRFSASPCCYHYDLEPNILKLATRLRKNLRKLSNFGSRKGLWRGWPPAVVPLPADQGSRLVWRDGRVAQISNHAVTESRGLMGGKNLSRILLWNRSGRPTGGGPPARDRSRLTIPEAAVSPTTTALRTVTL